MKKPRLAIVSTFDDDCGIAGYTRSLCQQIEPDFEVDVFDLDQAFMRSTSSSIASAADRMVREFCAGANRYDFVNIQFEPGTFGLDWRHVLRRLEWIVEAAPALSVTFHTMIRRDRFDHRLFTLDLLRLRIADAIHNLTSHRGHIALNKGIERILHKAARVKPVSIIMHTRRDARVMQHSHGFPVVYDHPLVFKDQAEAARLRAATSRADFPSLESLPADARIVGVFGFISEYKGFETAIRALRLLPENYHLAVFGGLHPEAIRRYETIHPYLRRLLDIAAVDTSIFDVVDPQKAQTNVGVHVSLPLPEPRTHDLIAHPASLARRIHFLGPQTDEDFARGMSLCESVVIPYIEVAQTSSGVLSLALDMGARIVAARNLAFLEFGRYFPNSIEWFDVGNHVELAERLRARAMFPPGTRTRAYGVETNRAVYRAANSLRLPAAQAQTPG